MFDQVLDFIVWILGLNSDDLNLLQTATRALLIYICGIALVRIGKSRFIGKHTAFDTILAIIIGSLLSRAVTEATMFVQIMTASLIVVLLHWLFSWIAAYSDRFGDIVKGKSRVIIENGNVDWKALRKSHLSREDLLQALRLNGKISEPDDVRLARLERNGDVSVLQD